MVSAEVRLNLDGGAVRLHPLEAQLFGGGGVTSAQLPKPAPRPKPPPPARVMSVAEAERAAASEGIRLLRAEKSPTGFMGVRLREDGKYMAWGSRTDLIGAYTTAAGSTFNGMALPGVVYIQSRGGALPQPASVASAQMVRQLRAEEAAAAAS